MPSREECEFLPWDSSFFKINIARVRSSRLTEDMLARLDASCPMQRIDCLYFLADLDDPHTVRLAEAAGFGLVDVRVTLTRRLSAGGQHTHHPDIRAFEHADLPRLRQIAATSHTDSRFYTDGRFAEEKCRALFETWIERSCSGWAQAVFVPVVDGTASGYCTCHIEGDTGRIGLVALAPAAQSHGNGPRLLEAALSFFSSSHVQVVRVVTQGRNCRAQRLYQRCGFLSQSVQLWYHKWFPSSRSQR